MNRTYRVEFAIDVDAESPEEAAKRGWELLNGPDAMLPVAEVIEHDGDGWREQVDLQELEEIHHEYLQRSGPQSMGDTPGKAQQDTARQAAGPAGV